jgi:MFS family permease
VILSSSALALLAAALIVALGDGPHLALRKTGGHLRGVLGAFASRDFRAAVLGYFGHMWEVYAFWTIVPLLIIRTSLNLRLHGANVSGLAFAIIAVGSLGCAVGGRFSHRWGSGRVAVVALAISASCCLVFAAAWQALPPVLLLIVLLVWGASVAADSPQFSALAARTCPPDLIGGALAIQISIGFAITMISIAAVTGLFEKWGVSVAWLLLPGPVLGLIGFWPDWGK